MEVYKAVYKVLYLGGFRKEVKANGMFFLHICLHAVVFVDTTTTPTMLVHAVS